MKSSHSLFNAHRIVIAQVFFLLLMVTLLVSCLHKKNVSDQFVLNGYVSDGENATLGYLIFKDGTWIVVNDTTKIVDARFQFRGNIKELTGAYLKIDEYPIRIYLEPKELNLDTSKNNMADYKLTGTSVEKENLKLRNLIRHNTETTDRLIQKVIETNEQIERNPDLVSDSLFEEMIDNLDLLQMESAKRDSLLYDFVFLNKNFLITPDILFQLTENDNINIDSIKKISENFPELGGNASMRRLLSDQIRWKQNSRNSDLGGIAPSFEAKNLTGDTVNFENMRQKDYVLLDFWASWCGPCLKGIPTVKTLQEKYGDKELQIVGVSFDEDANVWKDAIAKNQMNEWSQLISIENEEKGVFRLKKVGDIYDVQNIPLYILINKQGKVIGRWQHLGEDELNAIDSIMNNTQPN